MYGVASGVFENKLLVGRNKEMSQSEKITAIAQHLADRVKDQKSPYSVLKWIVKESGFQYKASQSELWEAYFAELNILKASGIENAKRKPLTNLSKKERARIRKVAKHVAALLSKYLGVECKITRQPLKTYKGGDMALQMSVQIESCIQAYVYPTVKQMQEFDSMDECSQETFIYRYAQQFLSEDQRVGKNMETIKAQLECLL